MNKKKIALHAQMWLWLESYADRHGLVSRTEAIRQLIRQEQREEMRQEASGPRHPAEYRPEEIRT